MEERTSAQGSLETSNGGATKLLGVYKDESERIEAAGLGRGGWVVSGRLTQEKTPHDPLIKHWHKPVAPVALIPG